MRIAWVALTFKLSRSFPGDSSRPNERLLWPKPKLNFENCRDTTRPMSRALAYNTQGKMSRTTLKLWQTWSKSRHFTTNTTAYSCPASSGKQTLDSVMTLSARTTRRENSVSRGWRHQRLTVAPTVENNAVHISLISHPQSNYSLQYMFTPQIENYTAAVNWFVILKYDYSGKI